MQIRPLYTEHITDFELGTENTSYLATHGYAVNPQERWLVTSDERGYIITRIQTHVEPLEFADAVEDQLSLYTCTCSAYRYHHGLPELETGPLTSTEACKHVKALWKKQKSE